MWQWPNKVYSKGIKTIQVYPKNSEHNEVYSKGIETLQHQPKNSHLLGFPLAQPAQE